MATLLFEWLAGPDKGGTLPLDAGEVLVGSGAQADIHARSPSVATLHCRLYVSGKGLVEIEDLGSETGTHVEGEPVHERGILPLHARVALGRASFRVVPRNGRRRPVASDRYPSDRYRRRSTGRLRAHNTPEEYVDEATVRGLERRVEELETELLAAQHDVRRLKAVRLRLEAEIDSLRNQDTPVPGSLPALTPDTNEELLRLRAERDADRIKIEGLERALDSLRRRSSRGVHEVSGLRQTMLELFDGVIDRLSDPPGER